MIQDKVWLISVLVIAAMAGVFLWVAASARIAADAEAVQRRAYRLRAGWFWLLLAVIAVVSATTLAALPYPDHAPQPQAASRVNIRVTGAQWAWTIEGPDLVAGQPVEFQATSTDVNHGFGIYDPALRLLAQTQAMPGYINRLQYTFATPGTYHILCLEYCGLAHHEMMTDLVVKAK